MCGIDVFGGEGRCRRERWEGVGGCTQNRVEKNIKNVHIDKKDTSVYILKKKTLRYVCMLACGE